MKRQDHHDKVCRLESKLVMTGDAKSQQRVLSEFDSMANDRIQRGKLSNRLRSICKIRQSGISF